MNNLINDIQDAFAVMQVDFINWIIERGLKLLIAIVLLFIGLKIINIILKIFKKAFNKSKMDVSLAKFMISLLRLVLKIGYCVLVIHQLVVDISPFLAVGAAASIGVGLALQGSLANLVGGVLILVLRPFSVGDYISEKAFGNEGTVEDIQVFYTTLLTKDNKTAIIPNGLLSNNSIINFTRERYRRVDLIFSAEYAESVEKVKGVLLEVIHAHPLIIKDKEIFVNIGELGKSSIDYHVWVWCESINYLKVKYDLLEMVRAKFLEQEIEIPFPQMEVKIKNPL